MKWTLSLINCTNDASSNRFSRVSIRRCMLDYRGITFVCNFEVGQKVATARDCIYLYIYTLQTQHTGYQTLENKISIWRPDENWTMTAVCKALPFLLSHSVVRLKSGWKSCSTWNFGFDLWIFFKKEVSLCSNIEFETRDRSIVYFRISSFEQRLQLRVRKVFEKIGNIETEIVISYYNVGQTLFRVK